MVKQTAMTILGLVALLATGIMLVEIQDTMTGQYVSSGGGRYYYGDMPAQLQYDEACIYQGYEPLDPWRVQTNEFGTMVALCKDGNRLVEVPLVQIIRVRP